MDIAYDGGEADRALSSNDYDLAILDVGLPVFDGFEVLRRLRQRARHRVGKHSVIFGKKDAHGSGNVPN